MCAMIGGGLFIQPKTSHAQAAVVVAGGIGTIQDTISAAANTVISGLQNTLNIKEFALDDIAFKLAKKVLADSTASLVDWINSGFEGKPAFITNLNDYLLNAGDEVMGDFLANSNMAFLCEPLRISVQLIVEQNYIRSRNWEDRSQCTLSGAVGNIQQFVEGDFDQGGWKQWFSMVSQPQNNIYGAAALGITRSRDTVTNEKENLTIESLWSNGMRSVKDCSTGKCIIVTPGNVISEYLNFKLTVGDRTLIEADEINEIIGALMSQLGNQAIAGVGGLLGLSYSQDGTTPSYLDSYQEESNQMIASAGGGAKFLDDAIRLETRYAAMYEKALDDVEDVISDLESCTASAADNILADAEELQETYELEISTTDGILALLTYLKQMFTTSPDPSMKQQVTDQFLELQQDDVLHTASDIALAEQSIADEVVELQNDTDDINCP